MPAAPLRVTPTRVVRHLVAVVVALFVLTGCQLDVVAEVVVDADGTGEVVVTAEADAELVNEVPTIADELVLDDVVDAGWTVDGPNPTEDGGLLLTLRHDFQSTDEATNLLRSLGPPFNDPIIGRGQDGERATNTVSAELGLPDGFATFADEELQTTLGGVPFGGRFRATDADPANSINAVLRVTLPGELVESQTNATILEDGRLEWTAPTDGTILDASARSEQLPSGGAAWARPVATVALVALIAWITVMTLFICYVALARWRRARRYRRRALP